MVFGISDPLILLTCTELEMEPRILPSILVLCSVQAFTSVLGFLWVGTHSSFLLSSPAAELLPCGRMRSLDPCSMSTGFAVALTLSWEQLLTHWNSSWWMSVKICNCLTSMAKSMSFIKLPQRTGPWRCVEDSCRTVWITIFSSGVGQDRDVWCQGNVGGILSARSSYNYYPCTHH